MITNLDSEALAGLYRGLMDFQARQSYSTRCQDLHLDISFMIDALRKVKKRYSVMLL